MGKAVKKTLQGMFSCALLLVLLATMLCIPGTADALDCSSCHENPPVDNAGRVGATTGQFPGSHNKHSGSSAGQYGYLCTKCHTSNSTTNHANDSIDMAVPINGNAGASYGKGPSFAVSNAAFSGSSCTNVACHSDGTVVYTGTAVIKTTPAWGVAGNCNSCHGNTTYSDYRKGAPLYASGTPKPNAHDRHVQAGITTSHDPECKFCHFTVVGSTNDAIGTPANHDDGAYTLAASAATYQLEDGDNITPSHAAKVNTTFTYIFKDSSHNNESTCSNVSCHPTGLAGTKAASKTAWNSKSDCTDCHNVSLQNNTGYHHAMRNYSSGAVGYPSTVPGATAGGNDNSRRCTMCHVDHNIFSPDVNVSNANGAAANIRTGIGDAVTATTGYTNSDFSKTGTGGICVSCHNTELFKDTGNVRVKNETGSTKTVSIVLDNYTGSAHEYAISSTMKRDSKVFYSDCSKCHNGRKGETAAFSGMTTSTHDNSARRLYAGLGTTQTDGNDAQFCYRCHSKTADAIGGTKKTVANKDYYNVASMSAASEDIYTVMQKTYRHDVANATYAGKHKPSPTDETLAYISANKHVSCNDCHDPHEARQGNHTAGVAALAKVLKGATGVVVTWGTNWTAPTYTASTAALPVATAEYQICFKCHSGANTNLATWGGTAAAAWTNLALEFNPNNASGHPVVAALPVANRLTAARLAGGWVPGSVMTCSDCHITDSAASKGPHGSSVKWMLSGINKAWPYTAAAANGTGAGTLYKLSTYNTGVGTVNGLFCLNCHTIRPASGVNGWHSNGDLTGGEHGGSTGPPVCVSCHIRVPHGGKISRLLQTTNAPARYRSNGSSGTPLFTQWGPSAGTVKGTSASSSNFNSSCSEHSGSGGEAW